MDLSHLLDGKLLAAYIIANACFSGLKICLCSLQDAGVVSKENKIVNIALKIADILSANVAHK